MWLNLLLRIIFYILEFNLNIHSNENIKRSNQFEPFSKVTHIIPDSMETDFNNPGINIFKRGQSNQISRKSEPIKSGVYDAENKNSVFQEKQKYKMQLDKQVQEKIERNKSSFKNSQVFKQ